MSPRPPIDRRQSGCLVKVAAALGVGVAVLVSAALNLAVLVGIIAVIVWTLRWLDVIA